MSKHTPGPWRLVMTHDGYFIEEAKEPRRAIVEMPQRAQGSQLVRANNEANARLIAAAPEMLTELLGARTALAAALHADASKELLSAALAGVEAAIAKAEGR